MKLIIDIPEDVYKRTVFYREFRDLSDCVATIKALEKATPPRKRMTDQTLKDIDRAFKALEEREELLDKIRAEIEKPLHDERCFDTADAKAQYIALNWCIEIIDKYRKEQE